MRDMCKARTKHKAQIPKMALVKALIKCKEHVEFYFHKWIVVIHLREGWNSLHIKCHPLLKWKISLLR
jgi:hypothetical protein